MRVELPSVLNPEIMSLLQLLYEGFCFSKALTPGKVTYIPNPFPLSKVMLSYSLAEPQNFLALLFTPFNWSSCGSHLQLQRFPSQPAAITSITQQTLVSFFFYYYFLRMVLA